MTSRDALSRPEDAPDALLQRLRELGEALGARGPERGAGSGPISLFRFTHAPGPRSEARSPATPSLMVLLAGAVSVRTAGVATRAEAGEILILPGRVPLELTLWPAADAAFRALEVELLAEVLVRSLPADLALGRGAGALLLRRPSRAALAALVGFCEGVLEPTTHPRVLEHQLEGVLLALALELRIEPGALERGRANLDLALAIRQMVRANPDHAWTLLALARRLGLSQATLRRRLARRGTGLRRLVQEERMLVARTLLGDGRLNVTEVALRCGYGSPAKFARQFKHAFGVVPSQYRQGPRAAGIGDERQTWLS